MTLVASAIHPLVVLIELHLLFDAQLSGKESCFWVALILRHLCRCYRGAELSSNPKLRRSAALICLIGGAAPEHAYQFSL
jgi:hypothetical protein